MSNPTSDLYGMGVISVTLSPALVDVNTSAEQTFTVPGLKVGDFVMVNKPTAQAGLSIGGVRVSAVNTLAINFVNDTGGQITPTAAQTYLVFFARPDRVHLTARA